MHSQHCNEQDQGTHHYLGNALHTILQTHAANQDAKHNGDGHENTHFRRIGQHLGEHIGRSIGGRKTVKGAGKELDKVTQHPAADGGVVHHQHDAAQQTNVAVQVPLAALLLQGLVGLGGGSTACTPHGQLHGQHGNAHDEQEEQVEKHKHAAAILTGNGRKTPYIADADGASGTDQKEAQAGSEVLTLGGGSRLTHTRPRFTF